MTNTSRPHGDQGTKQQPELPGESAAEALRATPATRRARRDASASLQPQRTCGCRRTGERAIEAIAASVEQTAHGARMAKAQRNLDELAQSRLAGIEESSVALVEVSTSIASVRKIARARRERDSTAAAVEESARSIRE